MKRSLTLLAGLSLLAPAYGIINFEAGSEIIVGANPDGTGGSLGSFSPVDNADISNVIFRSGTARIQFSFSAGTAAVEDANTGEATSGVIAGEESSSNPLTSSGDPLGFATFNDGGATPGAQTDSERDGYIGLGIDSFLLRSDPTFQDFGTFTIDYVGGTGSQILGFQIWDIDANADGNEQYRVQYFDEFNNLLNTEDSDVGQEPTIPTSRDGRPQTFNYDAGAGNLITRVEITFIGTKNLLPPSEQTIGLAFDNFDPEGTIPEPSAFAGILGLAALMIARRRA